MAKTGPAPRQGERYPSGRLRPGLPPAVIQRMIGVARASVRKQAADQALATQLGWLRLHDYITDKQFAAGVKFAMVVGLHDRAEGMPARSAKSISYQRGFGGRNENPRYNPDHADYDYDAVTSIIDQFNGAMTALESLDARGKIHRLVMRVCIDDQAATWLDREDLRRGLDALVVYFGLTKLR